MEFIQAKRRGNGTRDFLRIASQHHCFGHARRMQVDDSFGCIVFHHVGDNNVAQVFSVFRNM